MSYRQVAALIKTELESISTIENVQDYGRHTVDWDEIVSLFKDSNDRLHVWIIEWNTVTPDLEAIGSRAVSYEHNITLWGLLSLKDDTATQKTLEDEADSILDLFNGQKKIGDASFNVIIPDDELCSLEEMDTAKFSNVLCNRAQMTLKVNELRAYS